MSIMGKMSVNGRKEELYPWKDNNLMVLSCLRRTSFHSIAAFMLLGSEVQATKKSSANSSRPVNLQGAIWLADY